MLRDLLACWALFAEEIQESVEYAAQLHRDKQRFEKELGRRVSVEEARQLRAPRIFGPEVWWGPRHAPVRKEK